MSLNMNKLFLWFFLITTVLFTPGAHAAEAINTVGRVSGSDAFIALVSTGSKAMAYVCDGAKISLWFTGAIKQGRLFESKNPSGAHLIANLSAWSVVGTLELKAGRALSFRTEPVKDAAGLYRARAVISGSSYVGGWIVLPDGEQRGNVVGGGTLFERVLLNHNPVRASLPNLGPLEPFLVTPAWVEQNVNL
jgi:hypothetical protein